MPVKDELLTWLNEQLAKAKKSLAARKDMEKVWRGGTNKSWQAVGCTKNRIERLEESRMQARIAERCARDVKMFEEVIEYVSGPPHLNVAMGED